MAESQKEMLKLVVPVKEKPNNHQNIEDSDSETDNVFPTTTSTRIKSKAATHKTPPATSRNK